MPFVDEEYVLNWLKSRGNLPADVVLEAVEAEDDSVDSDVNVYLQRGIQWDRVCTVQVNSGYVALNTYGHKEPGNEASFYSMQHGLWGVQPEDFEQLAAAIRRMVETHP